MNEFRLLGSVLQTQTPDIDLTQALLDLLLGPMGLLVFVLFVLETGRRGVWVWGREKAASDKAAEDWKAEAHAERQAARERVSGRMG